MIKPPRFVTDNNGIRLAVVLDIEDYERLLEELGDKDTIRKYKAAKAGGELPIPLRQAPEKIRRSSK